jgi:predicted  nucleic acid-binding Zn ribbon protein
MSDITKKIEALENLYEKVSEHFRYIEEFISEETLLSSNPNDTNVTYVCPMCNQKNPRNNIKHLNICPVSQIMNALTEAEKIV